VSGLVALVAVALACGGGDAGSSGGPTEADGGADSPTSGGGGPPGPESTGRFATCGGAIVDANGGVDPAEYRKQARLWDRATIDCRLGPKYADLEGAKDDPRPTAYEPAHQPAPSGKYLCQTFELSGACSGNCDYGSTSGQVLYAPDAVDGTGVERVQNYAYESGRICESFQSGGWLGGPRPEPALKTWSDKAGRPIRVANGFAQTEFQETNGGIMIFPDGLVGATGNQNGTDGTPYVQLPPNKVPTAVALTTYNEFAFVTIWDTDAIKGQVAIFVLRSVKPESFSIPYFALPNEGSFHDIQLLGYVDLPDLKTPTAISVSGDNGNTPGGHTPGTEYGNQTDPTRNFLTSTSARAALAREDYERRVPMAGQAVIASRWENKVTFLDLRPLAQFVRDVYFGPDDALRQKAAAQDVWPFDFEKNPEAKPLVVTTTAIPRPTAVRIGNQGASSTDDLRKPIKAWIGNVDGEVHVLDVSAFAQDAPRPVPAAAIKEIAKVQAGRNVTAMTRQGGNYVLVASRGDRRLDWVGVSDTAKTVFTVERTLRDSRLDDPVAVDASDRGPVVSVSDFTGKKLLNFRVGATENNGGKPPANYGCGAGGADTACASFEFGGSFDLPGSPFFLGTSNVN
jgi:hypothetical protein